MIDISSSIIVLGAGSWGSALALQLARNGHQVRLWGHEPELMQYIAKDKENKKFLPGFPFPDNISTYSDLAQLFQDSNNASFLDILVATPSSAFAEVILKIKPYLTNRTRVLCASKGLTDNGELLHDAFVEIMGDSVPFGLISGPSFAREVAAGLPTAVAIATTDPIFSQDMQKYFHSQNFRTYVSEDIIAIELGAVIKNVLAIAVGLSDGLGYGANTRSALITRGLAEIKNLCLAMGGKADTLLGLAGVGDLILTCTDNQSRNRRFGLALGQGLSPLEAEKSIGQVVEGKRNAAIVLRLYQKHHVEAPICEQVVAVIEEKTSARSAVVALLSRPPKAEY